jgi:hypothetical protein
MRELLKIRNFRTKLWFSFSFMILMLIPFGIDANSQRLSRDFIMDLWVNQAGFVPEAAKSVVTRGLTSRSFDVINTMTQEVAFKGNFKPEKGDFGDYSRGDFSELRKEGKYYVKSDTLRSYPFFVSAKVYFPAMNLIVGYFSLQRCGASSTGYLTPCHIDDGIRMDNGKHQDVSGGWHDASDLRKWIGATIYGMLGLGKTYELYDKKSPELDKILDELKWGNLYFLKMQEPQGYLMNFVGGDVKKHSDSNRWTDNEIGPEGGELAFVKPAPTRGDMLIFGRNDDRVIRTDALDMTGQYNFITSEAIMGRITRKTDPEYSKKCLSAAVRCYDWCLSSNRTLNAGTIGASIQAATEMYKTTKDSKYRDYAINQASGLKKLQVKNQGKDIGGFFLTSSTDNEPYKNISRGCLEFISLCDLVTIFPNHPDVPSWKMMITDYANQYLSYFSQRNSFGIIPFGLFSKQDPGGNRKVGEYWYRYFMHPELSWWVGINANIASAGVGLMKAAEVLNDPKLSAIAQQQLDWIIGVNPFNSSTIVSVGYNNPFPMLGGNEFRPATPVIPGAVMNGLGGDKDDMPNLITKSNYQQSEYWTPMVAYTLWLMAEISH